MPFSMNLWKVNGYELDAIEATSLDYEERLEDWIVRDPSILGLDLMIIGRQVTTEYGGRIDLLGIDRQGDIVIIELKRDKTPRDIVAQVLDYATWVKDLTYEKVAEIAQRAGLRLSVAFSETFDEALPDKINLGHSMVIVASELDDASERIVQYLATEHEVSINAIFFNFYRMGEEEILGRAWLMDPAEVQERSGARKQPIWSGYYFVNVGEGDHRNWDDNLSYGFVGAGQGRKYSEALKKLRPGDDIFAYMKGRGYVGYGTVTRRAMMIKDFVPEGHERPLLELELNAPHPDDNKDDPDDSEWVVGVDWKTTYGRDEAKTFRGVFANQNIVCKLRHEATVQFLEKQFEVEREN